MGLPKGQMKTEHATTHANALRCTCGTTCRPFPATGRVKAIVIQVPSHKEDRMRVGTKRKWLGGAIWWVVLANTACGGRSGPPSDHGDIKGVDVSRDATLVAVAGRYGRSTDGRLSIYDARTGQELTNHAWSHSKLLSLAFDDRGRRLATCSSAAELAIWQILVSDDDKPSGLKPISRLAINFCDSMAFSPKGDTLAVACRDGVLRIVDTASGRVVKELAGHTRDSIAVAFSASGHSIACPGATEGSVQIWDTRTWQLVHALTYSVGSVAVTDVSFSSDSSRLVVSYGKPHDRRPGATSAGAYTGDHVRVWDMQTGHLRATFRVGGDRVTSARLSPSDGAMIAGYTQELAMTSSDHAVAVIDPSSGERYSTLRGTWREPIGRWCGDNRVVVVDGRFISCWDVTNLKRPERLWEAQWSWRDNLARDDDDEAAAATTTSPSE